VHVLGPSHAEQVLATQYGLFGSPQSLAEEHASFCAELAQPTTITNAQPTERSPCPSSSGPIFPLAARELSFL